MKNLICALFILLSGQLTSICIGQTACGNETILFEVNNMTELSAAVHNMNNNITSNVRILLKKEDSQGNTNLFEGNLVREITRNSNCPCLIEGEGTDDGVKVTGVVSLRFKQGSKNITLRNIDFKFTNYVTRSPIEIWNSDYISFENCSFSEDSLLLVDSIYYASSYGGYHYYVDVIGGQSNKISQCSFKTKSVTRGPWIQFYPKNDNENHIIEYCSFDTFTCNEELPGLGSVIKIGSCGGDPDTETASVFSNIMVIENIFNGYDCRYLSSDGDVGIYTEVISNKSSGNKYIGNEFINCNGNLRLRCGVECEVKYNRFYGTNLNTSDNTGISMNGYGHKIVNNYFNNLKGMALFFRVGNSVNLDDPDDDKRYVEMRNCKIYYNTINNCTNSMYFGMSNLDSYLLPNNNIFKNNIVNKSGYSDIYIESRILDINNLNTDECDSSNPGVFHTNTWEKNIFSGENNLVNLSEFDFSLCQPINYFSTNPLLENINGEWKPSILSPAINDGSIISTTSDDIDHVLRYDSPDIGCHEVCSIIPGQIPHCFKHIPGGIDHSRMNSHNEIGSGFIIYPNPARTNIQLNLEAPISEVREINIYNIDGEQIELVSYRGNMDYLNIEHLSEGIYFLEVLFVNGERVTNKLMVH